MYQFSLLFVLSLLGFAYAGSNADLDSEIQSIIEQEGIVGLTWTMVSDGDAQVGSAGYANAELQAPMQPNQKVHVGSVAKTVLAIGVLRLAYEGQLSLESRVAELLPSLNFVNPWQHRSPITIRNLLDHTAGLDNIRMWQFLSTEPLPNTPLVEAFESSRGNLLKVRSEPGTQYSYSNMGYALLGMVIEAVTQQRYESYLDENLLIPLGMNDSSFEFVSQVGDKADPHLAMGYHDIHSPQAAVPSYLRPAGQFTTTAPDMAKFIQFLLADGEINGEAYIKPDHMAQLTKPLGTKAHLAGLEIGHGLALAYRDRHGVLGECHPGTTFGFRAYLCLFPEQGKGYFYAANTDSESANYEQFNQLFINKLNIPPASVAPANNNGASLKAFEGIFVPAPNNMAEFEFIDKLFNFIWLQKQDEALLLKSLQFADRQLVQVDDFLFRDVTRTQASHVFYEDGKGVLFISDGLNTYKKVSGVSLGLYWLSLTVGLAGLLYLFLAGLIRMVTRNRQSFSRVRWVLINLSLFALPVFLYGRQTFLQFGDVTAASVALAVISGLLPFSLLYSMWVTHRTGLESKWAKVDLSAMLMAMPFLLVLFVWGQLPVIFWQ